MSDRILLVDDDPDLALFAEMNLREAGYEVSIATDGEKGLEIALGDPPDLAVVDVRMPGMDGYEVVERLRADPRTSRVGIIMMAGKATSAERVIGLTTGADDYLVKPFDPVELAARVRGLLNRIRELRSVSPLTGLPGNVQIRQRIDDVMTAGHPFALLYMDLDSFKPVNDRYGFLRGDAVIQRTARLVQDVTLDVAGRGAFVGHVGGDDFVVLCLPWEAERVCRAIARAIDEELPLLYDVEDRERGYIEIEDRRGEIRQHPLLSISIGAATSDRAGLEHPGQVVAIATELKEYAKRIPGSSWEIDRRSDGGEETPTEP